MIYNIPPHIIENFIYSNFSDIKVTSTQEWHFNSPFSNDSKKRLYIEPSTGKWFDQKEQRGGNFLTFVSEYLDVPVREATRILIQEYNTISNISSNIKLNEVVQVHKELELPKSLTFFAERNSGFIYNRALNYLKSRKINYSELGYVYDQDSPYHERIFIPFYENGRIVYFQTRTFTDHPLRYKNPSGISAVDKVYNIDKIEKEIFIFEGVFDALSLKHQIGTCLLNSSLSREQAIKILDKGVEDIIFVPDNDPNPKTKKTIERNLNKAINLLKKYTPYSINLTIRIFRLPKDIKDFNEYVIETGKDFIDKEECEVYNKKEEVFRNLQNAFTGVK